MNVFTDSFGTTESSRDIDAIRRLSHIDPYVSVLFTSSWGLINARHALTCTVCTETIGCIGSISSYYLKLNCLSIKMAGFYSTGI